MVRISISTCKSFEIKSEKDCGSHSLSFFFLNMHIRHGVSYFQYEMELQYGHTP